jgi:hypothetical protein
MAAHRFVETNIPIYREMTESERSSSLTRSQSSQAGRGWQLSLADPQTVGRGGSMAA